MIGISAIVFGLVENILEISIALLVYQGVVIDHYFGGMVVATIIERKLRSTKVRLFIVPCCSIIPVSSERWEKTYSQLTPNFFVVL
jgi:hypothetical protein